MDGVLVSLQLVAGGCEHALVLRDAQLCCAPQHEGYRAVLRDSELFLEGVGLHSGQSGFIVMRVPITLGTERAHLECRDDVLHEHRKHAQHSCQQELRKLRGYQPSVRVFVPCHGRDHTRAQGPVGSGGLCPTT